MAEYQKKKITKKHEHNWINGKCECGAEKITWEEYKRRVAAWNNYFEMVKETESYRLFQVVRAAWKDKDFELVKECAGRARQIMEEGTWLPKPPFPDPLVERQYGRLVVE